MDKELINRAWSVLPKEFKEEVKCMWSVEVDCATKYKSELHKHRTGLLYELFGENLHWQNYLTSDTETEEMLTIPRCVIVDRYHALTHPEDEYDSEQRRANIFLLQQLFGSKCLPDEGGKLPANCQQVKSEPQAPDYFRDPAKKADVNRLRVAGMAMAAIISRGKSYDKQEIAVTALEYADALIAECGKGGKQCYEEALSDLMSQMLEIVKKKEA